MSCRRAEKIGENREKGKRVRAILPRAEGRGLPRAPVKADGRFKMALLLTLE